MCWRLLECPFTITKEELSDLLLQTNRTLTRRCDVNDTIRNVINVMLVDLALLMGNI